MKSPHNNYIVKHLTKAMNLIMGWCSKNMEDNKFFKLTIPILVQLRSLITSFEVGEHKVYNIKRR
jgi:hypothetical protein